MKQIKRLWQIRAVVKRYGLAQLLQQISLSRGASLVLRILFGSTSDYDNQDRAERLRLALEELGPVFVKLGQTLSTRPDLLPVDIATELSKLQEQVEPFDGQQALNLIKQCYGSDFEAIFSQVELEPMASASVAQVHAATLQEGLAITGKNGQASNQVVVKILRPGIEKVINDDLQVLYLFAKLLQKYWSQGERMKPVEVIREYDATIHDELDLRREAANCCQMGANFAQTDIIYVPQVYWDYTQKSVLVMERIYGTSIREVEQLKEQGHDLQQLAHDGVEVFFKQAFEDNFFHADMHPGNIYVSDKGKWIAIDFGIMGSLTDQDKQYLAENLLAFFNRDYRGLAKAHVHAGWVPDGIRIEEFEAAMRTVCEPVFAKPISEISFGKVLMEVFQTAQRFDIPLQPQLVLLYKTLLNIEGLGRQLYPQLNLWDTAKPFLENWMKQQLHPKHLFAEFKKDWPRWRSVLPQLPDYLMRQMQDKGAFERQNLLAYQKQQKKKQTVLFHQVFGFMLAVLGTVLYLEPSANIPISPYEPLLAVAGLGWAFLASRK